MTTDTTEQGKCALCDREGLDPEEHHCYGCNELICDDHGDVDGSHEPSDHGDNP